MAEAHDHMRRLMAGGSGQWHEVMGVLGDLATDHSPETESILRDLLHFEGELKLHAGSDQPHAMSAEDAVRARALQILAERDIAKHRDVIAHVARSAESEILVTLAESHLSG